MSNIIDQLARFISLLDVPNHLRPFLSLSIRSTKQTFFISQLCWSLHCTI